MYLILDRLYGRDWTGVGYVLGAAAFVAAAVGLLLITISSGTPVGERNAAAVAAPRVASPHVRVRRVAPGRRFTVAGADFTVDAAPTADWVAGTPGADAGRGRNLVAVAVEVIGQGRRHFNPALLSYLVRGPHHTLYAPSGSGVIGPSSISETRGLGKGEGAEVRLLFSLPRAVRRPVLAIQPAIGQALEVRVRLPRQP